MKLITALLFFCCTGAMAFDYNVGQIPCVGCYYSAPGEPSASSPGNWGWGSTPNFIPYGQGTFSDTMTFYAGNWSEPSLYYPPNGAVYNFTTSQDVVVHGNVLKHSSSGRGGGAFVSTATTVVTSAVLDGVPMTVDSAGNWFFIGPLVEGQHVIAAEGTATTKSPQGVVTPGGYYCVWSARVDGVLYNLVYNPGSSNPPPQDD